MNTSVSRREQSSVGMEQVVPFTLSAVGIRAVCSGKDVWVKHGNLGRSCAHKVAISLEKVLEKEVVHGVPACPHVPELGRPQMPRPGKSGSGQSVQSRCYTVHQNAQQQGGYVAPSDRAESSEQLAQWRLIGIVAGTAERDDEDCEV